MLPTKRLVTTELARKYYHALVNRDVTYDGLFYVGVTSTGVFCRASCSAKKPKFENTEFFKTAEEALYASYRCCKVCKPLSHRTLVNEEISRLVDEVEASPEHHWKTQDFRTRHADALKQQDQFKRLFGMTYIEYARARRMGLAMKHIRAGQRRFNKTEDAFSSFLGSVSVESTNSLIAAWLTTPLGPMLVVVDATSLHLLEFVERRALETEIKNLRKHAKIIPGSNAIVEQVQRELDEYFAGARHTFEIPLSSDGTTFQKKVWQALRQIPLGETTTYGQIALALEKPGASRAVGTANGANQRALVVPCHRVVSSDGTLGGYGGRLWRKEALLQHEWTMAGKPSDDFPFEDEGSGQDSRAKRSKVAAL